MEHSPIGWAPALLVALLALPPAVQAAATETDGRDVSEPGSHRPDALERLTQDVVDRHPGLIKMRRLAAAASHRAAGAGVLPEPLAMLTAFVQGPETRVGPQRLMASVQQPLPWKGKLSLRESVAVAEAAALASDADALELELATRARTFYWELAFLSRQRQVMEDLRDHLEQHEEIARARYSTGAGRGEGVLKLQAEITRVDRRRLEIEERRTSVAARLNALRDAPADAPLPDAALTAETPWQVETETLVATALAGRPELVAQRARIAHRELSVELARRSRKPDFSVGLTYTVVEDRQDLPGRLSPPPDNGRDVLGISGGVRLPLWKRRWSSAIEEAQAALSGAEAGREALERQIASEVEELAARLPLSWRQLRLLEDLLVIQAEEALDSALAGYVAGTLGALDLLDAVHVLFDAEEAVARERADYQILASRLEGAMGAPLSTVTGERGPS